MPRPREPAPEAASAPGHPQLQLEFARDAAGRTGLSRRIVSYPFSVAAPFHLDARAPDVATLFLQSASGGLFRDEHVSSRVRSGAGARVRLVTSSATIVHDVHGGRGPVQDIALSAEAGSALAYLPRASVLFPGSRLTQTITARLGPDAFLVVRDGFLTHCPVGMSGVFDRLRCVIELRDASGRLLVADRTGATGASLMAAIPGIGRGFTAFGSLFLFSSRTGAPLGELSNELAGIIPALPTAYGAVTPLRGGTGLLLRVAAVDGGALEDILDAGVSCIGNLVFE